MSLLRDMKLVSRDTTFCHATKVSTLLEFSYVARHCLGHCLNVCDVIISGYDKFL